MKNNSFAGIFPFIVILFTSSVCSGQSLSKQSLPDSDSGAFFLFVDYCGTRYNRSIRQQELVINAVKLPARLLKQMPRLKDNGKYSSQNNRIREKQKKLLQKYGGEKLIVRVNKGKFNAFYPKGLKKGFIIETDEFNRWNFLEVPAPTPPPLNDPGRYQYYWYWNVTDPININYGLKVHG
jgi:hypothetical protein